MYKEAAGTVISVKKQWWLKVNAKRVRLHAMDGAMFPHIVKVEYTGKPIRKESGLEQVIRPLPWGVL